MGVCRARSLLALASLAACGDGPAATGAIDGGGSTAAEPPPTTTGVDPSTETAGATTMAVDTSGPAGDSTTGEPPPTPGEDEVVEIFDGTHLFFLGDDATRHADVTVTLPPAELAYETVRLGIVLGCPNDLCDWWDRFGYVAIVDDAGTEAESITEVARFITPYRVGASFVLDVSHLRPVLAGEVTFRVFIDTWVGPGHENGDGWLFDASLELQGGVPARLPLAAIPLWREHAFEYGNPSLAIEDTVPAATVAIPPDATSVDLVSIITGHGQGNADNCAEFCPRVHGFLVGEHAVQREVWRDDCQDTPVAGQQGTWTLSRAGWCPGAEVVPWIEDVTAGVAAGTDVTVAYDVEDYVNTCSPRSPTCMGCSLGTGCEYDGGNHTTPRYHLSAWLVAYRD